MRKRPPEMVTWPFPFFLTLLLLQDGAEMAVRRLDDVMQVIKDIFIQVLDIFSSSGRG